MGIKPAGQEKLYWGAGTDDDIIKSSIDALVNAVNRYMDAKMKLLAVEDLIRDKSLLFVNIYPYR